MALLRKRYAGCCCHHLPKGGVPLVIRCQRIQKLIAYVCLTAKRIATIEAHWRSETTRGCALKARKNPHTTFAKRECGRNDQNNEEAEATNPQGTNPVSQIATPQQSKVSLRQATQAQAANPRYTHKCDICDKRFDTHTALQSHMSGTHDYYNVATKLVWDTFCPSCMK